MIATIAAMAGKNVQQSSRSCGSNFLAIVAITAIISAAQRSKSQRPLNLSGNDCSNHMETSLRACISEVKLYYPKVALV